MTSVISVSRRILKEIEAQEKDTAVKEIAKSILEFEMENWRKEKVYYKEYFDKLIATLSKRRLKLT